LGLVVHRDLRSVGLEEVGVIELELNSFKVVTLKLEP
jgi:hypothetical protein